MEFEQQREPEDNIEDVNETEDSQEKELTQEELAKIGERVLAKISKTKEDIEDFKNGKGESFEWIEKHKDVGYDKESVLATMEKRLKDLESFVE